MVELLLKNQACVDATDNAGMMALNYGILHAFAF